MRFRVTYTARGGGEYGDSREMHSIPRRPDPLTKCLEIESYTILTVYWWNQQKSHARCVAFESAFIVGGGAPDVRQVVLRFDLAQTRKNQRVTYERTTGIRHPSNNFYRSSCLQFEFTTCPHMVVLNLRKD